MADKAGTSDYITGESLADRSRRLGANRASAGNADALTKAQLGSTAGKGLGLMGKSGSGMPKQDPGESMSQYSERLRKYREMQAEAKDRALSK